MQEIRDDIKKLSDKLDRVKEDTDTIKVTLAVNTQSLQVHMARTEQNEIRINRLENWLLGLMAACLAGIVGDIIVRLLVK